MTDSIIEGYGAKEAERIVGLTYRQLDEWARTGFIRPSIKTARGSGTRRLYSYADLLQLNVVKKLLEAGFDLRSIKKIFANVKEMLHSPELIAHIVIMDGLVLAPSQDQLIDLLSQPGQGVLNVVPVRAVVQELNERVAVEKPEAVVAGDEQLSLIAD